jgi:hypothetical protein
LKEGRQHWSLVIAVATIERVRALRLLARYPDGCPETLMLAHGFTVALLAGLVRDRFATAELNSANVVWVEITDLGAGDARLYITGRRRTISTSRSRMTFAGVCVR